LTSFPPTSATSATFNHWQAAQPSGCCHSTSEVNDSEFCESVADRIDTGSNAFSLNTENRDDSRPDRTIPALPNRYNRSSSQGRPAMGDDRTEQDIERYRRGLGMTR
jgi:hypothetical protein